MKRALVLMIVVVIALVMASAAFAQDEPELGLGTKVISLAGSYQLNDAKVWNIAAGYGQFISEKIEVGGVVGLSGADGVDTAGFFGGNAKYHFISDTPSRTVPYVGISLGAVTAGDETAFGYGAQIGADFFMSAKQAVYLEWSWQGAKINDVTMDNNYINFGIKQYL